MFFDPFVGPTLKIEQSRRHAEAAQRLTAEYAARVEYGFVDDSAPEDRLAELVFLFSEMPPPEIALAIGDAVHNLRAALDLMMCDAADLRGIEIDHVAFPFARDEARLGKELRDRKINNIGPDIAKMVRDLRPYPDGNRLLWAVNELDIIDKHRMVMPVFQAVPFHGITAGPFQLYGRMHFAHGQQVFITKDLSFEIKHQGDITAVFPPDSPCARKPVGEALNQLTELVAGIVKTFAAHFGHGDADPTTPPVVDN